jgi:hypothetical protein
MSTPNIKTLYLGGTRNPRTLYLTNVQGELVGVSSPVDVVRVFVGPPGPAPVPTARYDFTESEQWIINHNLGRYPIVQLFNAVNSKFEGEVSHFSNNQVRVTVRPATAGFALIS